MAGGPVRMWADWNRHNCELFPYICTRAGVRNALYLHRMISRRNIRIKVFQTIYGLQQQNPGFTAEEAVAQFDRKLDDIAGLLGSVAHLLCQLCEYSVIQAHKRASKMMPTAEDLQASTKLAGNLLVQNLRKNTTLSEVLKTNKLGGLFDDEFLRKLFVALSDTPEYKAYVTQTDRKPPEEKVILDFILKDFIFENETASAFLEERFLNWTTDAEMIATWTDKMLQNAARFHFRQILSAEKTRFAHDLLNTYVERKETVFNLIRPKLVNWDAERVAAVDLILLHLGICELLYFPTIPVKVTINEYIDLAKAYSTLQSGQFVNGLLDNVRKELMAENRIVKEDAASSGD